MSLSALMLIRLDRNSGNMVLSHPLTEKGDNSARSCYSPPNSEKVTIMTVLVTFFSHKGKTDLFSRRVVAPSPPSEVKREKVTLRREALLAGKRG